MIACNPLYPLAEIRNIERAALAALPPGTLMRRAGQAAAEWAAALSATAQRPAQVLVFAGPGNNGGDALETAHHLAQAGLQVTALLYADPARYPADAQAALQRARSSGVQFADTARLAELAATDWTLAIDGLFGIGLARPISGALRMPIETLNALACPVLALDVPSGLDADTGNIVGDGGIAARATHTITFIGDKPGLHTGAGRDHAGEVRIAALQIEQQHFPQPHLYLGGIDLFSGALRRRPHDSHKGSYGDVAVVGGAAGMMGAAILAARAAAKCGAGRVFAAFLDDAPNYDNAQPELMCRLARELDFASRVVVAGPGLGASPAAHDMLARVLNNAAPLVLDADALNLVAAEPGLQQMLAQRNDISLITPHPLEAARLLGTSSAAVQADRIAAARRLTERFAATVILKGSGTVIARPEGDIAINPTGNPGLATGGTGDVLAGICGALLAQGWPAWEAALGATWLHGRAADVLVEQGIGPVGLTAGELIPCVRTLLNQLIAQHA